MLFIQQHHHAPEMGLVPEILRTATYETSNGFSGFLRLNFRRFSTTSQLQEMMADE